MNLKQYYKERLSSALVEESIAVDYGRSPATRRVGSSPPNSGNSSAPESRGDALADSAINTIDRVAERNSRAAERNSAGTSAPKPAPAAVPRRDGQIDNKPVMGRNGRPLSINPNDFSFNISQAARDQAQSNRDAISNARAETGSGLSRMARGADGRPVSSYVNPNSPEGRVEASIAAGNEPDLQRDPNTGRLDPTRSARNLDRDATAAGNAAFDKSVKSNLGIDNASRMNTSELDRKARDVRKQDTSRVEGEVRAADAKLGPMPTDAVGSNTQAMRIAKETERRRGFTDSLKGEGQKNQAQLDLRAKEATANTKRDFEAAAEYDAFRPSVTANDDTTLPARAAQGAAARLAARIRGNGTSMDPRRKLFRYR